MPKRRSQKWAMSCCDKCGIGLLTVIQEYKIVAGTLVFGK